MQSYCFCFTQRCLDEFCLKCFRNTGCQNLLAINSLLTKFFKSLCYDRFYCIQQWIWVEWFITSLICSVVCCGFVTDCQRGRLLGRMCFSWYRTYVMILCNWLILWQNALYLYLGRLRMCLTTSTNYVSRSSVEAFNSIQETNQESANSLKPDSWLIPARHLLSVEVYEF